MDWLRDLMIFALLVVGALGAVHVTGGFDGGDDADSDGGDGGGDGGGGGD